MVRGFQSILVVAAISALSGCAGGPLLRSGSPPANPIFVPGNAGGGDVDRVWERTVDVLHDYPFAIARENKLDGIIETEYKVGAGVVEPWHRDSIGLENRLESTLQSIRRKVFVTITPTEGGLLVAVQANKELENLIGKAANTAGGATFQENSPLQRDLDLVVGQTTPSGWIAQGRDVLLEQHILSNLQHALLP